jgi:hypothetical protein
MSMQGSAMMYVTTPSSLTFAHRRKIPKGVR